MKKKLFILYIFLVFAPPIHGQKKNYSCVILDSLFSAIQLKKAQNDFLLPLFKSGEIKTDGDTIYITTKDSNKIRKIDSVIARVNVKERNLFLDDVFFSLDTFNIIVDTFGFFDNSCNMHNGSFLIVNDYRVLDIIKETCNVIVLHAIAYTNSGAVSIALRNTKSNFVIIVGIRQHGASFPRISILGKHTFDPIDGTIYLE